MTGSASLDRHSPESPGPGSPSSVARVREPHRGAFVRRLDTTNVRDIDSVRRLARCLDLAERCDYAQASERSRTYLDQAGTVVVAAVEGD